MNYDFQLDYVSSELEKRKPKKVLLQFPEGLRIYSIPIVDELKRRFPEIEFIVSAEPSWGACDIAEDEAKLIGADLIVHFGHSPYTWYFPKIDTIFVRAESLLSISKDTINELINLLQKYNTKSVGLTATAQHYRNLLNLKGELEKAGYEVKLGEPSNRFMFPGQVLGCDYRAALSVSADVYVNISGGEFHTIGLGLAVQKPVIKVDPYTSKVEDYSEKVWKIIKIRYAKIYEALDANVWAIIQGLKVGQNRPYYVDFLKKKLEEQGKKVYVFTNKVMTRDALRNIDNGTIDTFVITSCPRIPTDDLYDYEKPVLTPGEARMIINKKLEPYIFPW